MTPEPAPRVVISTQRLIWILWCLGWAAVWVIFTLGLAWPLSVLSLACIALPVGKGRPVRPVWTPVVDRGDSPRRLGEGQGS